MQIRIQGQDVSLVHLAPIVRAMTLDLRGGLQKKNARLAFRFSCHCYSRGPSEGEEIPDGMRVKEGSKELPGDRIFSLERYNLSLSLVACIDNLIQSNGDVRKSRHLNFFATELVTVDDAGVAVSKPYFIFMRPQKKQDPNQPPKIGVFVESAYLGNPAIPGPKASSAPMPLSVVLGEVWENKR